MSEIERLESLKGKLNEEEKLQFAQCVDIFNTSFKDMIKNVGVQIVGEKGSVYKSTNLLVAFEKIYSLAKKYGVDFPEIANEHDARLYVIKYGKEILFN